MALKIPPCQSHKPTRPSSTPHVLSQAPIQPVLGRREILQASIALPLLVTRKPARADVPAVDLAPAIGDAVPPTSQALLPAVESQSQPQPYLDVDFQLVPPAGFDFVDTQPPYDPERRGPAPEPSPVRTRFDSPDGSSVVSVVVRSAQTIRTSILQVTDVSAFGGLQEAAQLLLPRGSRVVAASALQVLSPPRQTTMGPVEMPPKNYYRYEFTTPTGMHIFMSVAATKGRVFVCGGSTAAGERWEQYGTTLRKAVESFRLRT